MTTHDSTTTPARAPGTAPAMVGDPFRVLPLDAIRDVRNEALNHSDGDTFTMHGYTFVMPGALLRANTRLMLANILFAVKHSKPRYHDKTCYASKVPLTINDLRLYIDA